MKKALLISIRPEHALNILNGNKTRELRKSIPKGFIGWVYGYVTKGKPIVARYESQVFLDDIWIDNDYLYEITDKNDKSARYFINGTIPFRFWFDDYETYNHDNHGVGLYTDFAEYNVMYDDLEKLCLDYREIEHYGQGKDLYAWHIKKLEIFDKPMELGEFYRYDEDYGADICEFSPFDYDNDLESCLKSFELKRPPQNMMSVWVK